MDCVEGRHRIECEPSRAALHRWSQGAHLSSMRATSAGSVRVSQQLRSSGFDSARTFPLACMNRTARGALGLAHAPETSDDPYPLNNEL